MQQQQEPNTSTFSPSQPRTSDMHVLRLKNLPANTE